MDIQKKSNLNIFQTLIVFLGILSIAGSSWYFLYKMDENMKDMMDGDMQMDMDMKSDMDMTADNASEINISDERIRLMPPNIKMTAGYFSIENKGDEKLKIISASSSLFERVELHTMYKDGDAMIMKQVDYVELLPNKKFKFSPMGYHLMLIGPKKALKEGDVADVELNFSNSTTIKTNFVVKKISVMKMNMQKTWLPDTGWMPPMSNIWSLNDFYQLFIMWAIMMIAMMSPSILGSVLMYAKVNKAKMEKGLQYTPTFIFYLGYLLAWVIFSLGISLIQYPLQVEALMNPMLASISQTLSAVVLIIAGIYQFTPYKYACLNKCRTPLSLIMAQWKDGSWGALNMGLSNGFYCVFCCWFLMAVLLVAGVMNMTFVVILTLFVLVEKLLPVPESMESVYFKVISIVPGLLLISWGISFIL
ncbi:MAG: hypothetical protein CMD90_00855 [Gammaproteobacteria bacterium]|nr:hypothetical protein [Gammaproteobacteria bacterium]